MAGIADDAVDARQDQARPTLARGLTFPPELRLTLACCVWPPSAARDEAVRRHAAEADPATFMKVVRRHRVGGLAQDAIHRAGVDWPPEIASSLQAEAVDIVRQNLLFAAECARLRQALEEASVTFLFIKGVTLNILAYGSLGLKRAVDIDLLVDPAAYARACDLLAQLGYVCIVPVMPTPERILERASCMKDSVWRLDGRGITLELHQRLTFNPGLLTPIWAGSPRQIVQVLPGIVLPTLARNELFAYLCVHGALSGWSRLKWLADLAALLSQEDADGIEALYRNAALLGAGRTAGLALLLCRDLLGTSLSVELEAEIRRDLVTRRLASWTIHSLVRGGIATEVTERPVGTLGIHVMQFFSQRGLRHKVAEVRQRIRLFRHQPPRLPTFMQPIVPLLRLVGLMGGRGGSRFRR